MCLVRVLTAPWLECDGLAITVRSWWAAVGAQGVGEVLRNGSDICRRTAFDCVQHRRPAYLPLFTVWCLCFSLAQLHALTHGLEVLPMLQSIKDQQHECIRVIIRTHTHMVNQFIAYLYYITSSTRTRRGGSCLKDIYKTFLIYRTCMRRAPAKPVRACTLRNWCLVSHVTFQAPLHTSHLTVFTLHTTQFTLHSSHCTLHTALFILHPSQSTLRFTLHS